MKTDNNGFAFPPNLEYLNVTHRIAEFNHQKRYWSDTEWDLYRLIWRNSIARYSDLSKEFERKELLDLALLGQWSLFWDKILQNTNSTPKTNQTSLNIQVPANVKYGGIGFLTD